MSRDRIDCSTLLIPNWETHVMSAGYWKSKRRFPQLLSSGCEDSFGKHGFNDEVKREIACHALCWITLNNFSELIERLSSHLWRPTLDCGLEPSVVWLFPGAAVCQMEREARNEIQETDSSIFFFCWNVSPWWDAALWLRWTNHTER